MMLHGFLNVDKPAGITSHDVVARLRRLVGQRRAGHGGTLDPAATGVLPVALGAATRLLEYLVEGRKTYHAAIRFGVTTTTDDAEGAVVEERLVPVLTRDDLLRAVQSFIGTIQQVPPLYSAVQVSGQRMYDLARRGAAINVPPRSVEIDRIEVVDWQSPVAILEIVCGKGTYIRALARDLGAAIGCGAHLQALRRTAVGPLTLETAVPLDRLLTGGRPVERHLLPPDAALADWPRIDVDDVLAQRLRNGIPIRLPAMDDRARIYGPDGTLLALVRRDADLWRPFKVFRFNS
jgi:tRNA pseudouridine55 synthase